MYIYIYAMYIHIYIYIYIMNLPTNIFGFTARLHPAQPEWPVPPSAPPPGVPGGTRRT